MSIENYWRQKIEKIDSKELHMLKRFASSELVLYAASPVHVYKNSLFKVILFFFLYYENKNIKLSLNIFGFHFCKKLKATYKIFKKYKFQLRFN